MEVQALSFDRESEVPSVSSVPAEGETFDDIIKLGRDRDPLQNQVAEKRTGLFKRVKGVVGGLKRWSKLSLGC